MKKIIITGGTGYIGSAFISLFDSLYDIESLSRSNGFYIHNADPILQKLSTADIFINLASTSRDTQTHLLHRSFEMWKHDPEKIILNVGSCSGLGFRFPGMPSEGPWEYASSKASLYHAFNQYLQQYINKDRNTCQVKMITVGLTDSGPNKGKPGALSTDIVACEMQRLLESQYNHHSILI